MLPNLIIIGAMKCGTVSLHRYLALHPEVCMPTINELDFFVEERNWPRGLAWYKSHFPQTTKVLGERSTAYTKFPIYRGVPQRMRQVVPEAKLIYCVRNPVERIVSQYVHEVARGREKRSFEEAVFDRFPENFYFYYSRYGLQIEQYLAYFPQSQLFVLSLEELSASRASTLRSVFQFLEVDPSFEHEDFHQVFHQSKDRRKPTWIKSKWGKLRGMRQLERLLPELFTRPLHKPVISEALNRKLVSFFEEDQRQLAAYRGEAAHLLVS